MEILATYLGLSYEVRQPATIAVESSGAALHH